MKPLPQKRTGPAKRQPRAKPSDSDEDYSPGPEYRRTQAHQRAMAAVDSLCPAMEKVSLRRSPRFKTEH